MLLTIDLKRSLSVRAPRREFHNCRDLLKKRPYGDLEHNCMYAHGIFVYERHVIVFPLNVLLRLARGVGSGSSVSAHSLLRALRSFCCCFAAPVLCIVACVLPLPLPRIAAYCCLLLPRAVNRYCYCCCTRDTCFNWTSALVQKLIHQRH